MNWYFEVWRKYAVFSGRARRKEYWMFFLFNIIVAFIIGFVMGLIGIASKAGPDLGNFVGLIYNLAVFIPSLAVGVRRLHDTGRSGWWILVPFVNLVFFCLDGDPGENEYGSDPKMAGLGVQTSTAQTAAHAG